MNRQPNTNVDGEPFSPDMKRQIWAKGRPIPGADTTEWRVDICNNPIKWSDYGNYESLHGWEIDHITPVAHDGSDNPINLQPLYWKANRQKGDQLNWNCG